MNGEMTERDGARLHPLLLAGKWLLLDLLSTVVFVVLYSVTGSVTASIALAVAIGLAQFAWAKRRGTPIDAMQWLSLGLVLVFGTLSLVTQSPRFILIKPTLIYAAVGCVMCKPGWQNRYLPPLALSRAGDVSFVFGYVWAGMMFATALANLGLALFASFAVWLAFIGIFPIASKIALVLIQYGVTRFVVRRRMRRDAGLGAAA